MHTQSHMLVLLRTTKIIETIQKVALKIILGERYISYELSCLTFETTTLANRHEILCKIFATKNFNRKKGFLHWWRSNRNKVKEIKCRTDTPWSSVSTSN